MRDQIAKVKFYKQCGQIWHKFIDSKMTYECIWLLIATA